MEEPAISQPADALPKSPPIVVLACRVLESMLGPRVQTLAIPATFFEYGYHRTPKKMTPVIQAAIDALVEPSRIIVGYGLCGNGLVGLKARQHTLVVPRTDDCIAILLGSKQRYKEEFDSHPGTYYLTRGWLESGSNPLAEYKEYVQKYGAETADWVIDQQYRNYKRLVFVALDESDLEKYHDAVEEIAAFCRARWNMELESRIGTGELVGHLMREGMRQAASTADLLVIPPGGEITQEMFVGA